MPDKKAEAIKKRGQCKASITRVEKYLNQEEPFLLEDLLVRQRSLKETFIKYQDSGLTLDDLDDENDTEDRVLTCLARIERLMKPLLDPGVQNPGGCSHGNASLPSLDLTIFDGRDASAYRPFMEMFQAVVHNDVRIPVVKKFCFLKKYLRGEPLQLIDNLPVVGDSYVSALDLLKERYDNPALIIGSHVNTLLDLPKLHRGTAQQIRDLVAKIKQQIAALKNLKEPVERWDSILACIILRKIDAFTARLYHSERDSTAALDVNELLEFLTKRATVLEASPTASDTAASKKAASNLASSKPGSGVGQECQLCSESHRLYKCPKFALMLPSNRSDIVQKQGLCKICLGSHSKKCRFNFKCTYCNSKTHNSLIHGSEDQQKSNPEQSKPPESINLHTFYCNSTNVVLPTAKVIVSDVHNNKYVVRALLDCGSQISFCTTALANKLGLNQFDLNKNIVTLGAGCNQTSKAINIIVQSMVQNFKLTVSCSIIDKITGSLPQVKLQASGFKIPNFIEKLADDEFNIPGHVDLLLASDVFFRIIQDGKVEGSPEDPVLLNTRLGYVVSGNMTVSSSNFLNTVSMTAVSVSELDHSVRQFWEAEKVPEVFVENIPEHIYSERNFQETISLLDNRFQVKLPLKVDIQDIVPSDSYVIALQRFFNLEKRFARDPYFYDLYSKFIHEYLELGHAKVIDINNKSSDQPLYFLPHHAVLRPDKQTNKLRVVFDGSAKTKNGHSLNDIQCNGPVVQQSLFDILLLFRTYKYTVQCDVRHMYRMVHLHPEHRPLQNILWRENGSMQCLQLQTITYGLKSSAFLATRCLVELAKIYKSEFPLASEAILKSSFVDDIEARSNTLQGVLSLKKELISLMELGGFKLHKWVSNDPQILLDIPDGARGVDTRDIDNDKTTVKILGISYDARNDLFKMNGRAVSAPDIPTKRNVLSSISRLFDPMGFAGPVTVKAKLILQQIWQYNLEWDSPLPSELVSIWDSFYTNLSSMPELNIPRYTLMSEADEIQLIGYCDASNDAYGCCIYLRVLIENKYHVFLLCSKSRVAPLGSKLTIPKLELNGALLLAKVMAHVTTVLNIPNAKLFCDSKIVLGWLASSPIKLPAYIGNRTKEINKLSHNMSWLFTPGLMNPADILSRGMDPKNLVECKLWHQGPDYLFECNNFNFQISEIELPIVTHEEGVCHNTVDVIIDPLFEKYSSLFGLQGVVALILRFVNNCKGIDKREGAFTVDEYQAALLKIIKAVQNHYFHSELKCIVNGKEIKGHLAALSPFVDGEGILRVGGRLGNAANLDFAQKHPAILPKHCHVTRLIIRQAHLMLVHGGLRLVLSHLCQKYYIVNSVREIKSVISKCITCCRQRAVTVQQLMGSLPEKRVTPARVFENVGLDYCGPFDIKQSSIRRSIVTKGYVAVFVCFASKAVHLEVVSDMSTKTFLSALKRFISRRGVPTNINCDNGTTFKGASNQLKELYDTQNNNFNDINNFGLHQGIQFHFIPAYSPNHGGLWEAAVKSAKYHLRRQASARVFTYEQFNTVIVEVEGILNSRPLTPLTQDPNDFTYLTPGHYIIGATIKSIPQPDLTEVPTNRLRFWRSCEQIRQHFWAAWSKDYLSLLNSRTKWQKQATNLKTGMLVLLHSGNSPPLAWPMGRIVKVFHGKDDKVRVVEVLTADKKIHARAVSKIVVLPIE